jgi:hypothetical protein
MSGDVEGVVPERVNLAENAELRLTNQRIKGRSLIGEAPSLEHGSPREVRVGHGWIQPLCCLTSVLSSNRDCPSPLGHELSVPVDTC